MAVTQVIFRQPFFPEHYPRLNFGFQGRSKALMPNPYEGTLPATEDVERYCRIDISR